MKKILLVIFLSFISLVSFSQTVYGPINSSDFSNTDTIHVTTNVLYNTYRNKVVYEGDGIVPCGKAEIIEYKDTIDIITLNYNSDKSLVYLNNKVYKVFNKYNKIVLEQIRPIKEWEVIMFDRRYGNMEIIK